MAGNLTLQLMMTANDSDIREALQQLEQNIKRINATIVRESEKSGDAQQSVVRQMQREQAQASAARTQLGIRSEREIRREIIQTQLAYRTLARSGMASQNDLQRAAQASRQRIRELNQELHQSSKLQKGISFTQKAFSTGQKVMGALEPAMDKEKKTQTKIAQTASQLYSDDKTKSAEWIKNQGEQEIRSLTYRLVKENGGNNDMALDWIQSSAQQGMSMEKLRSAEGSASYGFMLATAQEGEYDAAGVAKLHRYLNMSGIHDGMMNVAYEQILKSGHKGDMGTAEIIQKLPSLLPLESMQGLNDAGKINMLNSLLQSLQETTASNPASGNAAYRVRVNAQEVFTPQTMSRLQKSAQAYAEEAQLSLDRHEDPLAVANRTADKALKNDKQYQQYKAQAAAGDDNAKIRMNLMKGQMTSILMSGFQASSEASQPASGGQKQNFVYQAYDFQPDNSMLGKIQAVKNSTAEAQQQKNESLATLGRSDMVTPLVSMQTKLSEINAEFPKTTLALTALAAAADLATLGLGMMSVGKGGLKALGGVGKWVGRTGSKMASGAFNAVKNTAPQLTARLSSMAQTGADSVRKVLPALKSGGSGLWESITSKAPSVLSKGGKVLGNIAQKGGKYLGRGMAVLGVGAGLFSAYQIAHDDTLSPKEKREAQLKNAGSTGGGLAGAAAGAVAGAAIGSVVPVIGTAIGGLVGSIIGGFGGSWLGEKAGKKVSDLVDDSKKQYPQTAVEATEAAKEQGTISQPDGCYQKQQNPEAALTDQADGYQALIAALGDAVCSRLDQINTVLSDQSQPISTTVQLMMDGRMITEHVARQQLFMYNRGV
ncbi:hypothetical protein PT286_06370 [Neisseriaceae bacterium ESL0693]|nr:hypothetical protein [Neisseriaceae bacterium ESL0693]